MTTTQSNPGSYVGIDDLTVDLTDGVLSVTLNRPDTLNSLTAAMLATIGSTLKQAATDPRVRVVRLAGAGRGFSSGAGISEADHANPGANGTPADVLAAANQAVRAIVELPKPVVHPALADLPGIGHEQLPHLLRPVHVVRDLAPKIEPHDIPVDRQPTKELLLAPREGQPVPDKRQPPRRSRNVHAASCAV